MSSALREPARGETQSVQITLNGEPRTSPAQSTLADLVATLDQPPQALATAVNGQFIARAQRAQHTLREGDAVFTFQPITGG